MDKLTIGVVEEIIKQLGPALDIEITPSMIEAGTEALALFDFGDPAEWIISSIYSAMESAERRLPKQLAQQLADTMRENERLKAIIKKFPEMMQSYKESENG